MRFNPPKGKILLNGGEFSIHDVALGKECALLFVSGNIFDDMAFFTVVLRIEDGIGDRKIIDTTNGWFSPQAISVGGNCRLARRAGLMTFLAFVRVAHTLGIHPGSFFFISADWDHGEWDVNPRTEHVSAGAGFYTAWMEDSGIRISDRPTPIRILGFGNQLQEIGVYEGEEGNEPKIDPGYSEPTIRIRWQAAT